MKYLLRFILLLIFCGISLSSLFAETSNMAVLLDEHGLKFGSKLLGGAKWIGRSDAEYLEFNGNIGCCAEIPVGPEFDRPQEISISLWFMLYTIPEEKLVVKKRVCATAFSRNWNWRICVTPALVTKAVMFNNKETGIHGKKIELNTWNHVAAVYSVPKQIFCLYVNGVKEAEMKVSAPLRSTKGYPVRLGDDESNYNSFNGRVSNVSIFKRALTPEEIVILSRKVPAAILRTAVMTLKKYQQQLGKIRQSELGTDSINAFQSVVKMTADALQKKDMTTVMTAESIGQKIQPLLNLSRNLTELRKQLRTLQRLDRSKLDLDSIGVYDQVEQRIKTALNRKELGAEDIIRKSAAGIYALQHNLIKLKDCLCFAVPSHSGTPILPESNISSSRLTTGLKLKLTPGEIAPMDFVLRPFKALPEVKFQLSDLKSKSDNVMPADRLDLKIVKCWYQAGSAWKSISQCKDTSALVPELLLNDDKLVKVDHEKKINYLRLNFPDGEKYVSICHPEINDKRERWNMSIKNQDYPVKDAATLQPIDLTENCNQQFRLTVKAPANIAPGIYRGKITVSSENRKLGSLNLAVKVLPFHLAAPKTNYDLSRTFTPSLYYVCDIDPESKGNLTPFHKTEAQYKNELVDLYEHGITNPLCYQLQVTGKMKRWDFDTFRKVLKLRKQAGLDTKPLYLSGPESNLGFMFADKPGDLDEIREKVKQIMNIVQDVYGHRDVYFYGIDERRGEELKKQRRVWNAIHEVGGKVFVSSCDTKQGNNCSFNIAGDLLDLVIYSAEPLLSESRKWHSKNHLIWSYCNPQSGVENPEVYRRNYGLITYQNNYDGFATYCYYESFGNPWDDFDFGMRDHNFVYPTTDGVIDTIAWDGYREAITDVRYATTLREAAIEARKSGDPQKVKLAVAAENWLKGLDVEHGDLNRIRNKMIQWILKLKK